MTGGAPALPPFPARAGRWTARTARTARAPTASWWPQAHRQTQCRPSATSAPLTWPTSRLDWRTFTPPAARPPRRPYIQTARCRATVPARSSLRSPTTTGMRAAARPRPLARLHSHPLGRHYPRYSRGPRSCDLYGLRGRCYVPRRHLAGWLGHVEGLAG